MVEHKIEDSFAFTSGAALTWVGFMFISVALTIVTNHMEVRYAGFAVGGVLAIFGAMIFRDSFFKEDVDDKQT